MLFTDNNLHFIKKGFSEWLKKEDIRYISVFILYSLVIKIIENSVKIILEQL